MPEEVTVVTTETSAPETVTEVQAASAAASAEIAAQAADAAIATAGTAAAIAATVAADDMRTHAAQVEELMAWRQMTTERLSSLETAIQTSQAQMTRELQEVSQKLSSLIQVETVTAAATVETAEAVAPETGSVAEESPAARTARKRRLI